MHLTLRHPRESIRVFPPVDLPPFTLVTGPNGSGKTHLLHAIKDGVVTVDNLVPDQIMLIEQRTLNHDLSARPPEFIVPKLRRLAELHSVFVKSTCEAVSIWAANMGIELTAVTAETLIRLEGRTPTEVDARLNGPTIEQLRTVINKTTTAFVEKLRGEQLFDFLGKVQGGTRNIFSLKESDFCENQQLIWGSSTLFQQPFLSICSSYRDLLVENKLMLQHKSDDPNATVTPLQSEQFESRYGRPPWIRANEVMLAAGLDFSLTIPDLYSFAPYKPELRKLSTGVEVDPTKLSSGEKVLYALSLALFQSTDKRQQLTLPRLILLDEVDAALHPAMARRYLNVIHDAISKGMGVPVMAVTHSVSTIAMAPPGSVYLLASGDSGLSPISNGAAINALSFGVPTLSIDNDGRRIVFVESTFDAEVYTSAFRCLRALAETPTNAGRSLEFIGVGSSRDGGCDRVREMVGAFAAAGNRTVFGVVDYDKSNKSEGRICVVAEGERYSIENIVFDPLTLAILLIKNHKDACQRLGLAKFGPYAELRSRSLVDLAAMSEIIQKTVNLSSTPGVQDVEYVGGFSLPIRNDYLLCNGHVLEDAILKSLPELLTYRRTERRGLFMSKVIEHVGDDYPTFFPSALTRMFRSILDAEVV